MSQAESLARRLREVILNGTWIANTNFKDQLNDVNWQQATKKMGSRHTIAELTFHIGYYISGILNVLEGGKLEIRDKFSFDLPLIESEQEWSALTDQLWNDTLTLAKLIQQLSDQQLLQEFVDPRYGNYQRNIEGIIEHSYYHLGQLVLIKKLTSEQKFK